MIAEDVAIRLTADSSKLVGGLATASAAVAKFGDAAKKAVSNIGTWGDAIERHGKSLKRAGSDIAEAGAIVSGFGALMVNEAAKYDRTVKGAVDGLKNAYTGLAIEVGRLLVPVVKDLSSALSGAVSWFRELSPETKDSLVTFTKWAAGVTAAGAAISGIGKVFEGLGNVIQLALSPLGAMLATLLLVVGAIGAIENASKGIEGGAVRMGRGITRAVGDIPLGTLPGLPAGLPGSVRELFPESVQKDLAATSGAGGSVMEGLAADLKAGIEKIGLGDLFAKIRGAGEALEKEHKSLADAEKALASKLAAEQKVRESIAEWGEKQKAAQKDFADAARDAVRRQDDATKPFATAAPARVPIRALSNATRSLDEFARAAGFFGGALADVTQAFITGGLVGVLITLAQHSKGFADTVAVLNGVLQAVADVVGAVLGPLQPLIASVMGLVEAIAAGLQPAFDAIASILEPFIPVIVVLGEVLKGMAPAIGMMVGAMQLFQAPMLLLVSKAMPLFFGAVKFIGLGLLKLTQLIAPVWNAAAQAVANVWNGIIDGLRHIFGGLADFSVFGLKPFAALNDFFDGLMIPIESVTIDMNALAASIAALEGLTWDAAMAKAKDTAETLKNGDAAKASAASLRKLGEELTNVPEGFKVTAARYAAMAAGDFREAASPNVSTGSGGIVPDLTGIPSTEAALPLPPSAPAPAPAPATPVVSATVRLDTLARELVVEINKTRFTRDGVPRSVQ